jgi:hypothetical protein
MISLLLPAGQATASGPIAFGFNRTPPELIPRVGAPEGLEALEDTMGTMVNLSSKLPPVESQGTQGSCVAWATSYYGKTQSEKLEHTSWNLSDPRHEFSPSFVYNQINHGRDEGSTFGNAFQLLASRGDVDLEEMPYEESDYTTQPDSVDLMAAKPYRIPDTYNCLWHETGRPQSDIQSVKAWLASGKTMVMGMPIYSDFPTQYGSKRKYYYHDGTSSSIGDHGVCICGYDDNANPGGSDADHRGGFLMVNSWGSDWNGDGYIYLSYDFVKRYVWEAWTFGDLEPDTPGIDHLNTDTFAPDDTIEIWGKNFGAYRRGGRVDFGYTRAEVISWNDGKVIVRVPWVSSSLVKVFDWEGTPSNAKSYHIIQPPTPTLTGLTPDSGPRQTRVTLRGSGFGDTRGAKYVTFGSVEVTSYSSWSNSQIVVLVPDGVGGKPPVRVTTAGGTSNYQPFSITPQISTINPTSGPVDTLVTVNGQAFGTWVEGHTYVKFGSVQASAYPKWSNGQIQVRVPTGVSGTVDLSVRTDGGTSSPKSFTVR